MGPLRRPEVAYAGSTSHQGAGGGMKFRCRRRNRLGHIDLNKLECFLKPRPPNGTPFFAPPAPRLRRGAGGLCLVPYSASPGGLAPYAAEPFGLLASSKNLRFRRPTQGPRLFFLAAQGACTPGLRPAVGLPSHASEPPAVSPCGPRSPAASLGLSPRSASVSSGMLFVIPAKARNPLPFRVGPICHSRTRLRGHRLRRESRGSGLPSLVLPAKRFLPSTFTIAERCHSDIVLPSNSEVKRRGISSRIGQ